ncbi:VC0807 family protein [Mycolicibacterium sp. 141076]|uniref:VC0807 family protein n=1 Tax=Mycolicibacterium sp. 141076 TaxID=3090599 RepID=UPI00299E906D|nr:VC0807 family protein [Mycolicibacterium sp. 141076]MDX1877877.1 VC0807 family protein [Mycolicibacterium sp. 141076]
MRPIIRGILLDIAPPLIAYYGLRAAGASEYVALLTATVLAGSKVAYDAIRTRRLDPFAGYLMLNFGLSLAVGLSTSDARLLLAGTTMVGGIGGLVFLGSCVLGTPLTQVVSERVQTGEQDTSAAADAYRRRVHILLSAMWGAGLIVGTGVQLALIFATSVDVANALASAFSLATTGVLMTATFIVGKRARARWEEREQPEPVTAEQIDIPKG